MREDRRTGKRLSRRVSVCSSRHHIFRDQEFLWLNQSQISGFSRLELCIELEQFMQAKPKTWILIRQVIL